MCGMSKTYGFVGFVLWAFPVIKYRSWTGYGGKLETYGWRFSNRKQLSFRRRFSFWLDARQKKYCSNRFIRTFLFRDVAGQKCFSVFFVKAERGHWWISSMCVQFRCPFSPALYTVSSLFQYWHTFSESTLYCEFKNLLDCFYLISDRFVHVTFIIIYA